MGLLVINCVIRETARAEVFSHQVTSRAVRVGDNDAWEEFDVTSAVRSYVTRGGKMAGLLRLRVTVTGGAQWTRRHLVFGEDRCSDVIVRELRHRHHPVVNVLTRDRFVRCQQ